MIDKEAIKKELDSLPDDRLGEVYEFIHALKKKKKEGGRMRTFHLKGQFDDVDVRKRAYE